MQPEETTYIALLRGINVSGQKLIKMERLRELFAPLGFSGVRTYIQSGNVVFEADCQDEDVLRRRIESHLASQLFYPVPVLVRSRAQMSRVLLDHPFPELLADPEQKNYVAFLESIPDADKAERVLAMSYEQERFGVVGRELYACVSRTAIKTLFDTAWAEKTLGTGATVRNWNTVQQLAKF